MQTITNKVVNIASTVYAPIEKVWESFTHEAHIVQWNQASPDWHCPRASNDLRAGGSFSYRMEARDGSFGFDFAGVYDEVKPKELIRYTLGDGRKVDTRFIQESDAVRIEQSFEAESENPIEMQQAGWQAILDSFKKHTELQS